MGAVEGIVNHKIQLFALRNGLTCPPFLDDQPFNLVEQGCLSISLVVLVYFKIKH